MVKRVVFGAILLAMLAAEFATAQPIPCVANKPNSVRKETWTFDDPRFNVTLFTSNFAVDWPNGQRIYSANFGFCQSVGLFDMNVYAAKDDQSTWQGWDFGDLVEFDYNEQLAMSPTGSKGEDETSTTTADTVRRFTQVFKGGDKGYPCHTPAGRTAFAHLYCHDGTTATCRDVGSTTDTCMDGVTLPSTQPCICSIEYDMIKKPCEFSLNILMHDCPEMDHVALNPPPPPAQVSGPTGGEIFGIILLVLFVVTLVGFAGGFVYNYKVNQLRGVAAIPCVANCRKPEDVATAYQPAPASSGPNYGSV